jgi:hypothetical protein
MTADPCDRTNPATSKPSLGSIVSERQGYAFKKGRISAGFSGIMVNA